MCAKRRYQKRGATLVELLTAASITCLVLLGSVSALFAGSAAWARGIGRIEAESDSQNAVRIISQQLREAMSVSVDADGKGLTYRTPSLDGNGNYVLPITWDGTTRTIRATGNQLILTSGSTQRVIAKGVIYTDPVTPTKSLPYRIFRPGPGTITRQVTIQVATSRFGFRGHKVASRSRETIFLRNVPQLTQ